MKEEILNVNKATISFLFRFRNKINGLAYLTPNNRLYIYESNAIIETKILENINLGKYTSLFLPEPNDTHIRIPYDNEPSEVIEKIVNSLNVFIKKSLTNEIISFKLDKVEAKSSIPNILLGDSPHSHLSDGYDVYYRPRFIIHFRIEKNKVTIRAGSNNLDLDRKTIKETKTPKGCQDFYLDYKYRKILSMENYEVTIFNKILLLEGLETNSLVYLKFLNKRNVNKS